MTYRKRRIKIRIDCMISSTTRDLPDHRAAVNHAVQRVGMYPLAMENLSAMPAADAISASLQLVDEAEIYIGVFGHRYGYIPDDSARNPTEISVTEMEYRQAMESGIPVLIYIMSDDHTMRVADVDKGPAAEKLDALKSELKTNHIVAFFDSPADLQTKVLQSLHEVKPTLDLEPDDLPAEAFLLPPPPEHYYHPPYILTNTFIGRRTELVDLDEWAASDDPIMVVEAIGGVGKSALTWHWVKERLATVRPDIGGVIWWSFYEGGTTVTSFIRHALAYITRQDPDALKELTYDERRDRLLDVLRGKPYLLVLDGFERALAAYHRLNAARMRDEEAESPDGPDDHCACTDPRDGDFLRQLAAAGPSKILIGTRLMPRDLQDHSGDPILGVQHKHLNGLHPDDAYDLMMDRGVKKATRATLDQFMEQFGYHSLLLKVVAGRIARFRRGRGDFDRWYAERGKHLKLADFDLKQRRTHILHYAFEGLDETRRKLLSQIAAFSDAVDYDTLAVFNPYLPLQPEPVTKPHQRHSLRRARRQAQRATTDAERAAAQQEIARLEAEYAEQQQRYADYEKALEAYPKSPDYKAALVHFDEVLTDLENRGVLQWDREQDTYDLHPIVRAYAFEQLEETDRVAAFERIRGHFESLPAEDYTTATELSDLKNTIEIYRALVGAGRLDDAAGFYIRRLGDALGYHIAAYHTMLELLMPLFPNGVDQLPTLADATQQSAIVNDFATALHYLGRAGEALVLDGLKIKINLEQKDAGNLGVGLANYADTLQNTNQLAAALRGKQLALELAAAARDRQGLALSYLNLLDLYRDTGQWEKAEFAYTTFHERPPSYRKKYWHSAVKRFYAAMLIYRGWEATTVLDEAEQLANEGQNAASMRQIQRWRGEVALMEGDLEAAVSHFNESVRLARKSGTAHTAVYMGYLAVARARQGSYDEARRLIEEALASRDGIYDSTAEVYLALGEREKAAHYAIEAYKWAWADGPPHSWWWHLERAKKLLAELGIEPPAMPPFDPTNVEPIPYEDEIRAFIAELKAMSEF